MEITYSKYGDYYLPDLAISEEEPATYGHFGRMRLKYLKEHCRATYINLKTSGQLTHHLNETDCEANEMLRLLIEQMAQTQDITEQLKSENQMAWVRAMNNIRSIAEEIVITSHFYCHSGPINQHRTLSEFHLSLLKDFPVNNCRTMRWYGSY